MMLKLFGKPKTPPPAPSRRDLTFGDPTLRKACSLAQTGDWEEIRRTLGNPSLKAKRSRIFDLASKERATDDWISSWMAAHDEPDAWLMRGARGVQRAFEIRGSSKAQDVSEDRWEPFFAALQEAEKDLIRAAERNGDDWIPWIHLLLAAIGLGHPLEERRARFEEARVRSDAHFPLHVCMMTSLTKKWGGSHELMFEFARTASDVPVDSILPTLIAFAHVERWLYASSWENDPKAEGYFRRPEVHNEILDAWKRSVARNDEETIYAANFYSFCFFKNGDKKLAGAEFVKTNGFVTPFPWCYDSRDGFDKARALCS